MREEDTLGLGHLLQDLSIGEGVFTLVLLQSRRQRDGLGLTADPCPLESADLASSLAGEQ